MTEKDTEFENAESGQMEDEQKSRKWQEFADKRKEQQQADQQAHEGLEHPDYQQLQERLNAAEQKSNEHWDKVLRLQAELENVRRRADENVSKAHKFAIEKFLKEFLPVIDSLEQALQVDKQTEAAQSVIQGVELTVKMCLDVLSKFGVEQLAPQGEPFDPNFHEAMSMQEDPEVPSGHVIMVVQKGYLLHDRLIRPARVIVAK